MLRPVVVAPQGEDSLATGPKQQGRSRSSSRNSSSSSSHNGADDAEAETVMATPPPMSLLTWKRGEDERNGAAPTNYFHFQ